MRNPYLGERAGDLRVAQTGGHLPDPPPLRTGSSAPKIMQKHPETSWDLTTIIPKEASLEKEKQKVFSKSYEFINKWKGREDYLKSPDTLKEALSDYEGWLAFYAGGGNPGYYIGLKHSLDQRNSKIKAALAKIEEQTVKIENDIQFFEYRLSKVPPKQQKIFLKYPTLKRYNHFLKKLFENAKYLLSEKEEKILNFTHKSSYSNWVQMTSSLLSKEQAMVKDEKGKKRKATLPEITSFLNSPNKNVRDTSAKAFNKLLAKNADIAENEMNSILQSKKIIDELRAVPRPDLIRHLEDDIETEVVDTLIKSVADNFWLAHKYYELKSKLLKVKKLKYHERNVEYGKINVMFKYEGTVELIGKVLRTLNPQFSEIFSDMVDNRHIDVYPKLGKTAGAFCAGGLISQPTFILLNHTNRFSDVLTLAHETGHAIHNFLSKKTQTPVNYEISLATAETASTFVEDFIVEELLKTTDPKNKLAIIMHKLNSDISTIFRQTACYKFELELHKNFRERGYLSKSEIGKLFQKNMRAYMGNFVEQSPGSENWWVYWSHIRSFFYVYSYTSGLLISKSLQSMVKENPKNIDKVKKFLSAGSSKSTYEIFEKLGIDITDKNFWLIGIREVENLLEIANNLAQKL